MKYDPIKKNIGQIVNNSPLLRKIFYFLLDILLLRAWHIRKEIKKFKTNISGTAEILDAGSGFGQYSYFLSRQSSQWKIFGIDIKKEQIDDCNQFFDKINQSNQVKFEYANLTEYSKENFYNLILSVDVMEHIEDDIKVFENFYYSLKKNGTLLISTPSDMGGSDVHDEDEHSFIDEHVRDGYNIDDITNKLQKAGFKNISTKYSYGNPGKISWKISMKYPIQLLTISKLFFIILPLYYIITLPIFLILNYRDLNQEHTEGTGLIVKAKK
ncbi:MAG: class I SAM-dependent methyltransferase [Bacteroidales bacterium]|jgi:SAM-dependent methyltransferase|nr:class I SAM-dependent methyltransferase [Bacteroidales bacterium]